MSLLHPPWGALIQQPFEVHRSHVTASLCGVSLLYAHSVCSTRTHVATTPTRPPLAPLSPQAPYFSRALDASFGSELCVSELDQGTASLPPPPPPPRLPEGSCKISISGLQYHALRSGASEGDEHLGSESRPGQTTASGALRCFCQETFILYVDDVQNGGGKKTQPGSCEKQASNKETI